MRAQGCDFDLGTTLGWEVGFGHPSPPRRTWCVGVVALPQTTQGGMAGGVVRTQILLPITQVLIWSPSVEGSNAQGSLKAQWHSGATEPELDSEDTTSSPAKLAASHPRAHPRSSTGWSRAELGAKPHLGMRQQHLLVHL